MGIPAVRGSAHRLRWMRVLFQTEFQSLERTRAVSPIVGNIPRMGDILPIRLGWSTRATRPELQRWRRRASTPFSCRPEVRPAPSVFRSLEVTAGTHAPDEVFALPSLKVTGEGCFAFTLGGQSAHPPRKARWRPEDIPCPSGTGGDPVASAIGRRRFRPCVRSRRRYDPSWCGIPRR